MNLDSEPTSPIYGFSSDGNVRPQSLVDEVNLRLNALIKSQQTGRLLRSRRRRSVSLTLDFQPVELNKEVASSADSLIWDPYSQPLNNTAVSNWSEDTCFDVSLVGSEDPDSEDTFHDTETVLDAINDAHIGIRDGSISPPNSDSPLNSTVNDNSQDLLTQTTMDRDKQNHRIAIQEAAMFCEDDIPICVPSSVTREYLQTVLDTALQMKTKVQQAMVFLQETDEEVYKARFKDSASNSKKCILEFIKKGQEHLKIERDKISLISEHKERIHGASLKIKSDRVNTYKDKITMDISELIGEFRRMSVVNPETDSHYHSLNDRFSSLAKRSEAAQKEAETLYKDAVDTGLEEPAMDIERHVRDLKDIHSEVSVKIGESKETFGIRGSQGANKIVDLTAPEFTGELAGKMDFYTFRSEYDEYISTKVLSLADQLRVLKKTCLKGVAQDACKNFESLPEVWDYLRSNYGNPNLILNAKIDEIRKLGSCLGSNVKKREWGISVLSKLKNLQNLAEKHNIVNNLYYSPMVTEVTKALPPRSQYDFKEDLEKVAEFGDVPKDILFSKLLDYLEKFVKTQTFNINFDISTQPADNKPKVEPSTKPAKKVYTVSDGKNTNAGKPGNKPSPRGNPGGNSGGNQSGTKKPYVPPSQPARVNCSLCSKQHTHLFYCEIFMASSVKERIAFAGDTKTCWRCLRMDSEVNFNERASWFAKHYNDCRTKFPCRIERCKDRKLSNQMHMIMCEHHTSKNKDIEDEFIKSLDPGSLPHSGAKFFFNAAMYRTSPDHETVLAAGQLDFPDVFEPPIYMVQNVQLEPDKTLFMFYDSGCMGAAISNRAYSMLDTENIRPGPTTLNVAGGEQIVIEYGEERFTLPLYNYKPRATLSALRMESVTNQFPYWELQEAWEEINKSYRHEYPDSPELPRTEDGVGGKPVDVMIGMRYSKYFPTIIYTLPNGLSIYEAKFAAPGGCQSVLGGVHESWVKAFESVHSLGYRTYFTSECRAYQAQYSALTFTEKLYSEEIQGQLSPEILQEEAEPRIVCSYTHCSKHEMNMNWMIPLSWDLENTVYSVKDEERRFQDIEALGSENEYRCVSCRNCTKCKNGDMLEKVSLREELEQAMIENSVELIVEQKRLEAKLPFIDDPVVKLKPNRYLAEKVLQSQLRNIEKNPEILEDVLKSHRKLEEKGHVSPVSSLSSEEKRRMDSTPGEGYFIPWRNVFKDGSLSTPCRMVFDASSRTPGGESLNCILAKGQNKLAKIVHLLIQFITQEFAVTADVSMAYNGIKLAAEHYIYQKYLWKEDLNPDNPTIIMIVKTLIYGVRSAGNQTMAGFDKLADFTIKHFPEHKAGAEVLKKKAYMDDIAASTATEEECRRVAADLEFTLAQGGMNVKAFTFSGHEPDEKVSADGETVGLIGYLWNPVRDTISLDIKELFFGKPKRGKLPEPVTGDIGEALKKKFTRRTLVGKTHGVFDPLGFATPLTAKFKLDLHDLCFRKLDWDDDVPEALLSTWVTNLETMQEMKRIKFRRTVIPENAANTDIELLISVDASKDIAVAAVHARIQLKDGGYHTQIMTAKSKLVSTSTIPRAELKGAVMGAVLGHVVKSNLGSQYKSTTFVTDSTICLYWIHQDERPMHIAIRNSVIEIRRFSLPEQWFHTDTHNNIADLGTRTATIHEIDEDSDWQRGKPWMRLPRGDLPLKSAEQVTLSGEEKRIAAVELKAPDLVGCVFSNLKTMVGDRYSFSKYTVDPCIRSWPISVRILGYVLRFVARMKATLQKSTVNGGTRRSDPKLNPADLILTKEEIESAENYFFRKATKEIKQYTKKVEYKDVTEEKDKILYYTGRILDGQEINSVENTMKDLEPLSFVRPVIDRYSPVAYSIMLYSHTSVVNHRNAVTTLRESRSLGYILRGRDLANEVYEACVFCKRYKKRLLAAEMGKLHETRLTIAPAFYNSQVDLMGPFSASCEHNHRSKVSVWGLVFKDPSSCAISVHVMEKYDTASFLMAYTRFSSKHGHPEKLFIDEGGQLLKGCKEIEFNIIDVAKSLDSKYRVGIEFSSCPVGGHNVHGMVERSIKEVKKIFTAVYSGLKLSIMGYETAFAWTANEINCLPVCLGSRYENLDHLDLITPSRLLYGRNNRRAPGGFSRMSTPSKMIEDMELVFESWWKVWKDERLIDFIPQPRKWRSGGYEPKPGDLVIFMKHESDVKLGEPVWRLGRVREIERSKDGVVRTAVIEYKNSSESVFRTTRRSVRRIAVLHKEGELELIEELNQASKYSNLQFILRNL